MIATIRFLEINIEPDVGWQSHINGIATKINKNVFALRILSYNLGLLTMLTAYYAFVHSYLNYGTLLWGNHDMASKLFVLQKKAVRIICGVPSREHCKPVQ